MKKLIFIILLGFGLIYLWMEGTKTTLNDLKVEIDPFQRNPLSALITFSTHQPAQIQLTVLGRDGTDDIKHTFTQYEQMHSIPVLGLYPNHVNKVILKATYQNKKQIKKEVLIPIGEVPQQTMFVMLQKNDDKTKYHYLSDGLVFDEKGYLRLSFANHGNIVYFSNGELVLENRISGLERYSLLGEEKQKYPYPNGFTSFTHGISQKPNGNFLVVGSFANTTISADGEKIPSHREFVIELDYKTGKMLNKIDLAEILNPNRAVIIPQNHLDYGLSDWCHINGVDYDPSDAGIIVSCLNSGVIKINEKTKELVWIISPNKGFEKSGRSGKGPDISHKVLTAINEKNEPFSSKIQQGAFSNTLFKWPTHNHNAKIYPNHILTVYDNAGKIYDKDVYTTDNSNASIYEINEEKKTIKQLWRKQLDIYSCAGSSVLYHPEEKEVVVYSSSIVDPDQPNDSYGQLVRYDLDSQKVLFLATVYRGRTLYHYRNEDFEFYPKEKP